MNDSKWRFCLRFKRFYRTCFIADSRVSAHYERGWNDAVSSLMASIRPLYKGQEPFLKTLLEGTERPIPRAAVTAALRELRAKAIERRDRSGFTGSSAGVQWAINELDATIAKLGLADETQEETR